MAQILHDIAERYRSSNSLEAKVNLGQYLQTILEACPSDTINDRDLRETGLPEQVLHTALGTRSVLSGGSSNSELAQSAISTLAKVVLKLDLLSDGYVFAQELLENFEAIASQIIKVAAQPQTVFFTIYSPLLQIIAALFSNKNYFIVLASSAGPAILRVLLQSLLAPAPNSLPPTGRVVTYGILAYNVSRKPVQAFSHASHTILEKLKAETKNILSQFPAEHLVKQMTEVLGEIQDDNGLQDFCYVVTRFLLTGQGLQANLLRHGRLHIPIVNAWWRVGRAGTLKIRPDDATATLSSDPLALRTLDEYVLSGAESTRTQGMGFRLLSAIESPDIQRQVFRNLLNEADLMHLLGRVVSLRDLSSEGDTWYPITWQHSVIQRLAVMCQGERRLIDGRVQEDWLYVGERLAAIARSDPITDDIATSFRHQRNWRTFPEQLRKWDVLDLWSLYAVELGFESNEALEKDTKSRKDAFGGDAGCHWLRCPFYGGDMIEFGINVLRCTGCGEHCLPETALEARYPSVNMPDIEHAWRSGVTARR